MLRTPDGMSRPSSCPGRRVATWPPRARGLRRGQSRLPSMGLQEETAGSWTRVDTVLGQAQRRPAQVRMVRFALRMQDLVPRRTVRCCRRGELERWRARRVGERQGGWRRQTHGREWGPRMITVGMRAMVVRTRLRVMPGQTVMHRRRVRESPP